MYTPTTDPPAEVGSAPLRRPRRDARRILLILSEELRADGAAASAHEAAVAALNAVVGDTIEYALAPQSAAGAVSFQVRLNPSDPGCGPRVRAFTSLSLSNGEIVGGSIVHCSLDAARSPTATHETGHTFGLRHS
ncbi:MAG TPA: hypothetical protein VGL15_00580, partial [Vicinamibacteria bacterium]